MDSYTSKQRRDIEIYEEYWRITAALTDIFDTDFHGCLNIIITFIKNNKLQLASASKKQFSRLYSELQDKITRFANFKGKDPNASARKVINTFVKLGFVAPYLLSYHKLCEQFLKTHDPEEKRIIFSKIFYANSSFSSNATHDNRNHDHHMQFFLTTLERNQHLSVDDIKALMVTDISQYPAGFLTATELAKQRRLVAAIDFEDRKYNQISHFTSFLKNFVDVKYIKDENSFFFADDPEVIDREEVQNLTRDPVRYRIFRNELKTESKRLFEGAIVCFVERKSYKGLVASHIKPSAVCIKEGVEDEAYDVNNGLLLNQNLDQYFNDFDITFDHDGHIIVGKHVAPEIAQHFANQCLAPELLNPERQRYLDYHRNRFAQRNQE